MGKGATVTGASEGLDEAMIEGVDDGRYEGEDVTGAAEGASESDAVGKADGIKDADG
jgi:hypothetical protein